MLAIVPVAPLFLYSAYALISSQLMSALTAFSIFNVSCVLTLAAFWLKTLYQEIPDLLHEKEDETPTARLNEFAKLSTWNNLRGVDSENGGMGLRSRSSVPNADVETVPVTKTTTQVGERTDIEEGPAGDDFAQTYGVAVAQALQAKVGEVSIDREPVSKEEASSSWYSLWFCPSKGVFVKGAEKVAGLILG